ncbi:4-coumarate-CoA ligase 2a [Apiospora kogelbergensis]|uniref:4-coumarate-CoA ligase 2a n=1 Tax=Apiospora kogelbergensis TaxID=1337665 RepID=A0AAW0R1Q3_9PEZI
MSRIYTHRDPRFAEIEIPALDFLTLLFESQHSLAQDSSVVHVEAAWPANKLTKADLRSYTEQVAHGLRTNYGIGVKGPNQDVVTVVGYGQILMPAAFFGVIAAGGVFSAASPSSTVAELSRQISQAKSNVVICGSEHLDVAAKAAAQCNLPARNVLVLDSTSRSLNSTTGHIKAISGTRLTWDRVTDRQALRDSLIVILWSSGTTGLPKGVMMSHQNLVAETFITSVYNRKWAMEQAKPAPSPAPPFGYRALAHLPTSHIAGLFGYFAGAMYAGGAVYWMRKYDWAGLLRYAREFKITAFYTVPSIYLRMSKAPEVTDQFSWLAGAVTGAAPMDGKLQQSANKKLGGAGERLQQQMLGQTWGLSETTGAVTAVLAGESDDTGSIGSILPTIQLRLVDDDFRDVEPGREGELVLKGPVVTRGYYNNPAATRDAFRDGWFLSGDIGVMRNGKFYVVDRKKELLKYKGLQVAPAEIEGLLCEHPLIKEAAVIGLADPSAGDLPCAFVVPVEDGALAAAEVKKYVADRLAPHNQLRGGVLFIDEIPKNAIGKLLRRELRERAKKELGAAAQGAKL